MITTGSSKTALIIGSSGFVGRHLGTELERHGWEVRGFNWRDGNDIRDYERLRNGLDYIRPHAIFHLAAQAYVAESFANPVRTFEVNTIGSVNLLEAVRQLGLKTRILLAGTSEEYGANKPDENGALDFKSPYAISKVAMDYMGQLYARSYGLQVVVTRAFNHTGPGRGEMYAESSFAKQIAEIEAGKRNVLQHGNLASIRNYTDVRDVVRAYRLAVNLAPGVYNICSDESTNMAALLDTLIGFAQCKIPTEMLSSLHRPSDFSFQKPSCKKLQLLTGWKPEIPLEKTLQDLLNYWRERA